MIIGVGAMTVNLLLSFLFSALFSNLRWMPHGGLALANSTATAVESIILLILMKKKLHGINGRKIAETIIKSVFASVGMGAVVLLAKKIISTNSPSKTVVMTVTLGGIGYVLFLILLRSKEIRYIFSLIRMRIAKKEL